MRVERSGGGGGGGGGGMPLDGTCAACYGEHYLPIKYLTTQNLVTPPLHGVWNMGSTPLLSYLVFGILQGSFAEVRSQFVVILDLLQ